MKTGGVKGYTKASVITKEEFYKTKVDVFIPACLEQMIQGARGQHARLQGRRRGRQRPDDPRRRAQVLREGHRGPPRHPLQRGGVTVSYFEWVQNKNAVTWSAEQVDRELNRHMVVAAQRTMAMRARLKCSLRTASFATALEHIGAAYKVRGIFP
jgi:glutamate dehydrogenase (NAD(P)+)